MIQIYIRQISILLKRLLVAYAAYFVCRVVFFVVNHSYFPNTGIFSLLKNCLYGLRFDSFSIVISNSLFVLLSILPVNTFFSKSYQIILKWIFLIGNSIFIAANFVDTGYFPFIRKRSTYDLFKQMSGQSDLVKLLPQFFRDFWWILLLYILMLVVLNHFYKKVKINIQGRYGKAPMGQWISIALIFLISSGLAVLGVRGGFQRIPIDIINAGSMTEPDEVPILLNTPFTLIKSVNQKGVEDLNYYTDGELKSIYNPVHQFKNGTFKKQNVVLLILESFSKEYTRLGKKNSITPFLDSLMQHSYVFTNAYSNGSKSIEGIPAISSSLPSLMENPFINSLYANNTQISLANILEKEGYQTAFFHGGINGTMNFDDWSASAGYKEYFGKNEYKNDEDFDNFWGIWDEPFLQYSVKKMTEFKEPFHTAIFTLSSHHPYFVPERYKNKFKKTDLENAESVQYADYALRQFFVSAKKTKWYDNTLFVLAADHGSISNDAFFSNVVGNQSIPILFYKPDNSLKGENDKVFSQIDILPSTLELIGYNKPFFAFGQSYLSTVNRSSYFYAGGVHYYYNDSMVFSINNDKITTAFNYKRDSTLTNNLYDRYPEANEKMFRQFRAFMQTYNRTLLNNTGKTE